MSRGEAEERKDKNEINPEGFAFLFVVSVFNPPPSSAACCGRRRANSGTIHWESTRDRTKVKMDKSIGGNDALRCNKKKQKTNRRKRRSVEQEQKECLQQWRNLHEEDVNIHSIQRNKGILML